MICGVKYLYSFAFHEGTHVLRYGGTLKNVGLDVYYIIGYMWQLELNIYIHLLFRRVHMYLGTGGRILYYR